MKNLNEISTRLEIAKKKISSDKISAGSKVRTEIIANNIAIPVKIPKYIVGIKFDNTRIEKPNTIVIDVFKIAIPTVLWHLSNVLL